ncbi:hypothetical protein PSCLAVI8L_350006 [Pseudoclavibacter sp. 8L]|nr:hypothetical protein PSCLAVI8L_350006 [Pseudoclavibacter sp. 8L]
MLHWNTAFTPRGFLSRRVGGALVSALVPEVPTSCVADVASVVGCLGERGHGRARGVSVAYIHSEASLPVRVQFTRFESKLSERNLKGDRFSLE